MSDKINSIEDILNLLLNNNEGETTMSNTINNNEGETNMETTNNNINNNEGETNMDNIKICANCGKEIDTSTSDVYEGECGDVYCEDCHQNDSIWYCDYCECYHTHYNDAYDVNMPNGSVETWCEESLYDNAIFCDHCEQWYASQDGITVHKWRNTATYCTDCATNYAFYCDCCEKYYGSDDYAYYNTVNDTVVCEDCYSQYYGTCDRCGVVDDTDNLYWSEEHECYYCNECYDIIISNKVHNYSYKPETIMHSLENEHTNLFLGFELESVHPTGDRKDCAEAIVNKFSNDEDYFYLKNDGSLREFGSGFEVVTHPMTLNFHKEFNWENVLHCMRSHGMKSHDIGTGVGLHVHASRKFLTPIQWIKVDWFVTKNRKYLETFSRRKENSWAQFVHHDEYDTHKCFKSVYGKSKSSRYYAVNFANRHTVEFRLFRGSLRTVTVMATLEFVHALCNWVKVMSATDIIRHINNSWGAFCDYVLDNHATYSNLIAYLKEKDLIG